MGSEVGNTAISVREQLRHALQYEHVTGYHVEFVYSFDSGLFSFKDTDFSQEERSANEMYLFQLQVPVVFCTDAVWLSVSLYAYFSYQRKCT